MSVWKQTSGKGEPVVLVHGWGMNAAVWQPWLEQLNKSYQVTCVELPGHGFSPLQADQLNLDSWVEAIAEVVPDNAIWIGWSLGGLVVLSAALKQVKSIRAVYLLSATPSFTQQADWQCAMPLKTFEQFADNLKEDIETTLLRFLSLQIKGSDLARDLLKQLREGFSVHPQATQQGLLAGLQILRNTDVRSDLKQLKMPVHWTFGERDTLVPVCAQSAIARLMPEAGTNIIKGAGHLPFLSHPDDCLNSLAELFQRSAV